MFRFPWTNFHELNLDWILEVVKKAQDIFTNGESDIANAVNTAEQALTVAEQAAAGVIGDGAVTTPKLANNAVTNAKLANNSVTTDNIVDRTIIGNDIAENTIESYNIKNGTIIGADIASETIASANIGPGAITYAKIADDAVNTSKIADRAVTADKIADNAISSTKINGPIPINKGGTGATTEKDALTALGAQLSSFGLLLGSTVRTTQITQETFNNRKLTDYKLFSLHLARQISSTTTTFANAIIPFQLLQPGYRIELSYNDHENVLRYVQVSFDFTNDTISYTGSNNILDNTILYVYGIDLNSLH